MVADVTQIKPNRKRPMTMEWPERIYVKANGHAMENRTCDADTGISLPNTVSVTVVIGCDGYNKVTVVALNDDYWPAASGPIPEPTFITREFTMQPHEIFGFTCEPAMIHHRELVASRDIVMMDPVVHDSELAFLAKCPHCCGKFLPPDSRKLECRHCGTAVDVDDMLVSEEQEADANGPHSVV